MGKDSDQCSPVDPNYSPSEKQPSESYVGAKSPMDHPLTQSTVDPNYGFSGSGSEGGPKPSSPKSSTESSDTAGVEGAGGKYTDDEGGSD